MYVCVGVLSSHTKIQFQKSARVGSPETHMFTAEKCPNQQVEISEDDRSLCQSLKSSTSDF